MNLPLMLQYLVIALAVVISAWVVANKQFPQTVRRLRTAMALSMVREGRSEWMRSMGRRIAPPSAGGGSACGGCGGSCGSSSPPPTLHK